MKYLLPLLLLALASCSEADFPATSVHASLIAVTPGPVPPAVTTVTLVDVQTHGYAQAPAWFVRVRYSTTSNLPHIVIEETATINGQALGNVRVVDLARYEYDVFYDGAAPSGRQVRAYPAQVAGVNWHNGVGWVNHSPFPPGVQLYHLDVAWPDIFLHPRSGAIVQADLSAAVNWTIDISNQSVVTVHIP